MFNVILAMDSEGGIGYENKLPWSCKSELDLFKSITMGNILIMGRKTIENLPKLKNRIIVGISRNNNNFGADYTYNNLEKAIQEMSSIYPDKKIFIAGGAQIYDLVFKKYRNKIDRLYLSIIKEKYVCDTFVSLYQNIYNITIIKEEKYEDFIYREIKFYSSLEIQYLMLLNEVLTLGENRNARNGITKSVFGKHLQFDLRREFPLLTTKKMFFRGIVEELLFFIKGETNSKILEEKRINIWKGNTSREFLDSIGKTNRKEGLLGEMYGYQWRNFNAKYNEETGKPFNKGIDQLKNVVNKIKSDPQSRRILLTDYNPLQAENGVLYPCHSIIIQFYVSDCFLDMFVYNRSSDLFLGLPFNIASSSLFLILIAKITKLIPRNIKISLGDCHIYEEHYEAVKKQIKRIPYKFPKLTIEKELNEIEDIENLTFTDFKLNNYLSHPIIKAPMIA